MMRARNLGAMVHRAPAADGAAAAAPPLPPTAAEVVLHFDLLAEEAAYKEQAGSGGVGGGAGSTPAEPAVAGSLLVRRRVGRSGGSELAVRQLAGAAAAGGSSGGKDAPWQAVSPAALRELLAAHDIQTEAVDRWGLGGNRTSSTGSCASLASQDWCAWQRNRGSCHVKGASACSAPRPTLLHPALLHHTRPYLRCRMVVMQHRQAVAVQDPAELARYLELLIGTAGPRGCCLGLACMCRAWDLEWAVRPVQRLCMSQGR